MCEILPLDEMIAEYEAKIIASIGPGYIHPITTFKIEREEYSMVLDHEPRGVYELHDISQLVHDHRTLCDLYTMVLQSYIYAVSVLQNRNPAYAEPLIDHLTKRITLINARMKLDFTAIKLHDISIVIKLMFC